MKLILPLDLIADIEPHLPSDTEIVRVDVEGNLYEDASDAEIYFSWFLSRSPTLHKIIEAAPALRWHHAPNAEVNHILIPTYLKRDIILKNEYRKVEVTHSKVKSQKYYGISSLGILNGCYISTVAY